MVRPSSAENESDTEASIKLLQSMTQFTIAYNIGMNKLQFYQTVYFYYRFTIIFRI